MNNYILISRTFTAWTPESAEAGDFSETGYIAEREAVTFRDLVGLMEAHPFPSSSDTPDTRTWFSCEPYIEDYGDLETREESIHFHKDNTPNAAKYWKWAAAAAQKKRKTWNR